MDELDFLKQHWQNDQEFPKVNKEEIRRMLHKSSSSIVKWIFLISVIELLIGIVLNSWFYFFDKEPHTDHFIFQIFSNSIDVIAYFFILYFIYTFFSSYKKIKNTKSTKELLSDILITRKTVHNYIRFNIYLIIVSVALATVKIFFERQTEIWSTGHIIMFLTFLIIVMFIVGWVCIAVVKLYYRLIYIRLVKKLDKNYEELIKLDEDEGREILVE